jgi:hypothetical protein
MAKPHSVSSQQGQKPDRQEFYFQAGSSDAELETLLQKEQLWLAAQTQPHHYFEAEGWRGSQDSWLETLNLPWGPDLADRWLAEGSPLPHRDGND